MKTLSAFFIGTDGELKYFSMPEKETLYCDCRDCYEASERRYSKAIEVAKTEAVDIHDMYVYQVLMHRYFPHYIDYSKTPKDNFNMHAACGHVYPITMNEEIEVVEVPADSGFMHVDSTSYPTFKKVARIIPKKAEDEHQVHERVKSDDVAMFADDDSLFIYDHFYRKGMDDAVEKAEESEDILLDELRSKLIIPTNLSSSGWIIGINEGVRKTLDEIKKHFEIKRKA
jgi:hypothetical protein